jgi:adenosylcobinamide kinase/adenosylcobinamide-phosphate guanylyltransferase
VITLVLGGARSGKSAVAERLVARLPPPVTYVATIRASALAADEALGARVRAHQERRPSDWRTVEAAEDLGQVVVDAQGTVLVDALGPWVAGVADFAADAQALCRALTSRQGDAVVVSEEVGLGVHPLSDDGRRFRDALGEVNQAVAAIADDVWFVVAGRCLRLGVAP